MSKNCYDCKFALRARHKIRTGEQVRCEKAEELFGGERWVDVRRSEKTGKLLNSKCGTFEHFKGDEELTPEPTVETVKVACKRCNGSGKIRVKVMDRNEQTKCTNCNGEGKVTQ